MTALYTSIWLALVLFAAGEIGRTGRRRSGGEPGWARPAFAAGAALAIVHTLLAFALAHDWSHADAVRSTALQTEAVYGFAFGGGVYVNYLFLAVWLADATWWRRADHVGRSLAVTWTLRSFYLVIIVNAAVVFATGWRRAAGVAVVASLLWAWRPTVRRRATSSPRRRSPEGRTASL